MDTGARKSFGMFYCDTHTHQVYSCMLPGYVYDHMHEQVHYIDCLSCNTWLYTHTHTHTPHTHTHTTHAYFCEFEPQTSLWSLDFFCYSKGNTKKTYLALNAKFNSC